MLLEDLGLIGNCQYSALIDRTGAVVWCCLPRFDSEPLFSALLDARRGGSFLVGPAGGEKGTQRYLENSNVLETTFRSADGAFRVVDLAPRFTLHERSFRPTQLVRIVEPLEGTPRIVVRCDPILGWSRERPARLQGSNHLQFEGYSSPLRLTTDVPLTYVDGHPFALTERRHLALTFGPPIEEALPPLCERFLAETLRYWQGWVKHCNIPPLYQQEVIRSALALKLHCYEDSGAIVASMTTSIPEYAHSGRNWDYRYCWLRDAYYVLGAFRLLGHFEEREAFIQYLLNVAARSKDLALSPLYRIDGTTEVEESVLQHWPGYEDSPPVRVGNQAALQPQNDVFGEMVLALAPVFLDRRFSHERSQAALELLERLARKAIAVAGTPDASIWEYRKEYLPQTFSSMMCWAAADRMRKVAALHDPSRAEEFGKAAERIRNEIIERAYSPELGGFAGTYGKHDLDASLLQMAILRLLPPDDARLTGTIDTIWKGLEEGGWLLRYRADDGLGETKSAFILCTFWLVEALAVTGRMKDARAVLESARVALSPLGLLSEDYDPRGGRLWGNFPQAYSHVGLIHAAFEASPRWSEVL